MAIVGCVVTPRGTRTIEEETKYLEAEIGRKFWGIRNFHAWDAAIVNAIDKRIVANGHTLICNTSAQRKTDGTAQSWADIAAGGQDTLLRDQAARLKLLGVPFVFVFNHEPEDDVGVCGTPTDYRRAYRRIYDVFTSQGVQNITYQLDMMAWTFNPKSGRKPLDYWPGDFIDVVAGNVFNWYPGRDNSKWQSLAFLAQPFNDWMNANKPAKAKWIGASGCQEDPAAPNRKAQWFRDAADALQVWQFDGLVYYNSPKLYPWWFDSSSVSLDAFREVVNRPFFTEAPLAQAAPEAFWEPPTPADPGDDAVAEDE